MRTRGRAIPLILLFVVPGAVGAVALLEREDATTALERRADRRVDRALELRDSAQALRDRGRVVEAESAAAQAMDLLDQSVADYDRVLDLRIRSGAEASAIARIQARRGAVFLYRGCPQQALREADEAIATAGPAVPAGGWLLRAQALDALGNPRGAARAVEKALRVSSDGELRREASKIYRDLAALFGPGQGENPALEIPALRRAWELDPYREENGEVRETLHLREQDYRDRVARLEAARRQNPEDDSIEVRLAVIHARFGRYGKAKEIFDFLLSPRRGDPDPGILLAYAEYFFQTRDTFEAYDEAVRICREIQAAAPDYPGIQAAITRAKTRRALLEAALSQ